MGFGLIAGALAGAGNSIANSAHDFQKFNDAEAMDSRRAQHEEALARMRTELQVEAAKRIAEGELERSQAPLLRFQKIASKYAGGDAPVAEVAAPAGEVDATGIDVPTSIDTSGGWDSINASVQATQPERNAAQAGLMGQELAGETDPELLAVRARELENVAPGAALAPGVPVAPAKGGKMNPMEAALEDARLNDPLAYKAAMDAYKGEHVQVGPFGAIVNPVSGKVLYQNTAGMEVAQHKSGVAKEIAQMRLRAAAANPDAILPQETVELMAQQYLAGDTSVMQNLGRGAQGAENIIKVRKEITRQAKEDGKGGADLAATNAEYFGTKAGQRTAGVKIANVEMASFEAESLIPLAREASAAVARSGLLPFGKAQVMFDNQTNDPALRQFAAANNALVNVYSRAISPSGVPTVSDKDHAREMISTAIDHKSYMAALDQMQKEITAARGAPVQVRKAFSDGVTGKGGHGAPQPSSSTPPDIQALLEKYK